jgi:hypothetical protein
VRARILDTSARLSDTGHLQHIGPSLEKRRIFDVTDSSMPRVPERSDADALREVRAVYRELEDRRVDRGCIARTDCCRFRVTGRTPYVTKGELLVLVGAVRASGRTRVARDEAPDGACPLLDAAGRCAAYDARPFGCRTHFCAAAGGPVARRDVVDLIRRLEAVDVVLGGEGPRALPAALADALRRR